MKDWDSEKNVGLDPTSLLPQSEKIVNWKCHHCGYEWASLIMKQWNGLFLLFKKLVIKDVVQFTDRKLDTYKSIVPKDALGYLHAEQNPLMAADGNSSDDLFLID